MAIFKCPKTDGETPCHDARYNQISIHRIEKIIDNKFNSMLQQFY